MGQEIHRPVKPSPTGAQDVAVSEKGLRLGLLRQSCPSLPTLVGRVHGVGEPARGPTHVPPILTDVSLVHVEGRGRPTVASAPLGAPDVGTPLARVGPTREEQRYTTHDSTE